MDLIKDLPDGSITFYSTGQFYRSLPGAAHPQHRLYQSGKTNERVAGAYWRGDETRKQLTRIYAVTFPKQSELTDYLHLIEEAKKRDHRKLGKELELFAFSEK